MKKVIVFGTYDILHPGHQDFFRQAKKYGDYLVVVVARDVNVEKVKGMLPLNNENARLAEIKNLTNFSKLFKKYYLKNKSFIDTIVSKVLLGSLGDKYKILNAETPDVVCLGYDQKVDEKELQKKLKEYRLSKTEIIRLQAYNPDIYKSSKLKNNLGM